jgi:hypothetical protein
MGHPARVTARKLRDVWGGGVQTEKPQLRLQETHSASPNFLLTEPHKDKNIIFTRIIIMATINRYFPDTFPCFIAEIPKRFIAVIENRLTFADITSTFVKSRPSLVDCRPTFPNC